MIKLHNALRQVDEINLSVAKVSLYEICVRESYVLFINFVNPNDLILCYPHHLVNSYLFVILSEIDIADFLC